MVQVFLKTTWHLRTKISQARVLVAMHIFSACLVYYHYVVLWFESIEHNPGSYKEFSILTLPLQFPVVVEPWIQILSTLSLSHTAPFPFYSPQTEAFHSKKPPSGASHTKPCPSRVAPSEAKARKSKSGTGSSGQARAPLPPPLAQALATFFALARACEPHSKQSIPTFFALAARVRAPL